MYMPPSSVLLTSDKRTRLKKASCPELSCGEIHLRGVVEGGSVAADHDLTEGQAFKVGRLLDDGVEVVHICDTNKSQCTG